MKKIISASGIAGLFLLNVPVLTAQWETNGPYGGYMTSLTAKGSNLFVGTETNGVFRSSDEGKTWTTANKGLEKVWVMDLASTNAGIFAGTFYYGVYFSNNNGNTWSKRNNGLTSLEIWNLFTVGTDLYATTGNGIFFSSDNGLNWTKIQAGLFSNTKFNAWAQMGDTVYGGSNGSGLYMTDNKGLSWSKVGSTLPSQTAFYVFALAANGNTLYAGSNNGIYVSNDRGVNWVPASTSYTTPPYVNKLAIHSNSLYAGISNAGVYVSGNNAVSFSAVNNGYPNYPGGEEYMAVVDFLTTGSTLLAASHYGVYRTTDNGGNWSDGSQGILATQVEDVLNNGVVTISTTDYSGVFISSNNGQSWSRSVNGLPSNRMTNLAALGTEVYASVLFDKVYKSTNNGASWTWASNGLPSTVQSIEADSGRVIAIGEDISTDYTQLFQTTDHGANWEEIPASHINGGISAIAVRGKYIYTGGIGALLRTSNDGLSWVDLGQYLPMAEVSTILSLDSVTYIGTAGKGIFRFLYDDTYMESVSSGLSNYNISDIIQQNGILFASTYGGGVFVSVNGGKRWFPFNGGLQNLNTKKLGGANLQVYTATSTGAFQTIHASFDNIMILSSVNAVEPDLALTLFPNPANGVISYKSASTDLAFEIYNLSGELVYSKASDGLSAGTIDLTGQARGVYLMKIRSADGITVKRIVLD
jgi:photosystem II stability/assembly factor-like uncharacterized protein